MVLTIRGVRVTVRVGTIKGKSVVLLFDMPDDVMANRGEVQSQLDAIAAERMRDVMHEAKV